MNLSNIEKGYCTRTTYDLLGRPIREVQPDGAIRKLAWHDVSDQNGMTGFTEYHAGGDSTRVYSYDAAGRLASVKVPADSGKGYHERNYAYDSRKRTYTETDEFGTRTVFHHDKEGRDLKIEVFAANGTTPLQTVRNWYDNEGRLVMSRDPEGNLHRTKYDVQGRPMREEGPEGIVSERKYDLAGNVLWERTVSSSGKDSVSFVQDGAFRTVKSRWHDAAGNLVDSVLQTWDSRAGYTRLGMPVGLTGARGLTVAQTWDPAGRPATVTRMVTGSNGQVLYNASQSYAYTADGLLQSLGLGTGVSLGWKHDGLRRVSGGNIAKATDTLDVATVTARDAAGLVTGMRLGNGTQITQQYETGRPLVKRAEAVRPGATKPHWKLGLRYDARGDVERMDRPNGERVLYEHDALRRLTAATYSGGGAGPDGLLPTYVWEHGQDGRRLSWRHQFGKDTVLYRSGTGMPVEHRLSDGLVRKITYDHRGNRKRVLTFVENDTAANHWIREEKMKFDLRDGLRGYTKVTRHADGTSDTVVRHYVLDERGWRIAELDGDSTVLKKWVYRGNYVAADSGTTDGPSEATGWKYYNGLGEQPQAVAFMNGLGKLDGRWYLTDHLGSVTAVEDSAGERTLSLSLDPWGNLEVAKGSEGVGYGYTGKQLDALLGCSDHGARCLDNRMGMWWGRDKAKQFWNVYVYAGNNPINAIDPDGQQAVGVVKRIEGSTPGPAVQGGVEFALLFDFGRLSEGKYPLIYQTSGDVGGALATGGFDLGVGLKFFPMSPDLGFYMAPKVNVGASGGFGIGAALSQDAVPSVELMALFGVQAYVGGAMETGYFGDARELYSVFKNMIDPQAPYIAPNSSQASVGSTSSAISSSSGK